jgi:lysophospholipase L1-like esterase
MKNAAGNKKRSAKKVAATVAKVAACIFVVLACIVLVLLSGITYKGNAGAYSVENAIPRADSPLQSKRILFLGSSVTHGVGFKGTSFVEYLEKVDGVIAIKEAVSGTTLVDNGRNSYVSRLKAVDSSLEIDAFVCQLSTNDATKKLPLGEISEDGVYDTDTIAGAIEEIISYVDVQWQCPVIFYTGTRYDDEYYGEMVGLLLDIQQKWDIGVIDLWNDEALNDISEEDYKLYMINGIHPTKAGYSLWWLPVIERYLDEYLAG